VLALMVGLALFLFTFLKNVFKNFVAYSIDDWLHTGVDYAK